jgi:hypothetical protein
MKVNFSTDAPADVDGATLAPGAAVFLDHETGRHSTYVCPP